MERWDLAEAYERYVGRWSRPIAKEFVRRLGVEPGARFVDVGCGTGVLAETLCRDASPRAVLGIDPSEPFLDYARARTTDVRLTFNAGTAEALPVEDASQDAWVSALALNFFPSPDAAIAEARRVTCVQGLVAAYVWDYADGMQMLRRFWDAAVELDPAARDVDEGRRFPLCRPEALEGLFTRGGLADVVVTGIEVPTTFRDFDDLWSPFLTGIGPAPGYVTSLDDLARARLAERLRARLPIGEGGSIPLVGRAWSVWGRRRF